jgi:hypothetical protein
MAHAANQVRTQEGSCGLETLAQCSHQETSVGRLCHGVERARITFEIAPDRAQWGIEIAADWPDESAGQISPAHEPARF